MLFSLISILMAGFTLLSSLAHLPTTAWVQPTPAFHSIQVKSQALTVEVASTPQALTQGLSQRQAIGSDGMLFILPTPQMARFWMKDMLFDLDLIWIGQAKILGITANVPKPSSGQDQTQLPIYTSPPGTDMVLEVPAGFAQTHGWHEGDQVVLW